MHNCVYLLGKLANDPTVEKRERKKYILMNVTVENIIKDKEKGYETDTIPVEIYFTNIETYLDHIHTGDLVGIRGFIKNRDGILVIICDKISFLSRQDNEDDE